jgi:hypothetical protein
MTVKIGQHEFDSVYYDADGDILDLSMGDGMRDGVANGDTPEGHAWFYPDDESDEVVGLMLLGAMDQIRREGGIYVTLPSGERIHATQAEEAVRS